MDIGNRLKELRVLKGLTQEELADRSELSKGFISQLERNLTSPSIATLMVYSPVSGNYHREFLRKSLRNRSYSALRTTLQKVDPEYNNEIKWIIPNAQKNTMEPILLTLKAGGSTYPDTPHEGEEFGYILKGSVSIHLGKKTYHAKKGESFYYTADKKTLSFKQKRRHAHLGKFTSQFLIRPPL